MAGARRGGAHRWLAAWLLAGGVSGLALALLTPAQREGVAWLVAVHFATGLAAPPAWRLTWVVHRARAGRMPAAGGSRTRNGSPARPSGDGSALSGALAWWAAGGAVASGVLAWAWPVAWVARVHAGLGLVAAGATLFHVLLPALDDPIPDDRAPNGRTRERRDHFPVA